MIILFTNGTHIHTYINKLVKIELKDTYRKLNASHLDFHQIRKIEKHLPMDICNSFFQRHEKSLFYFREQQKIH